LIYVELKLYSISLRRSEEKSFEKFFLILMDFFRFVVSRKMEEEKAPRYAFCAEMAVLSGFSL